MDRAFLRERGDDYRKMHLEDAIDFIPYGTMVDEFQHIVYGNPELHLRSDVMHGTGWSRSTVHIWIPLAVGLWKKAVTGRDSIIFEMPFYYIDYVLAQLCAFQFKIRMEKDHDAAWADYMKLCRLSASDFYPSMLKQVGLTVPFTDGCIQKIVDELDKKLG